MALFNRNKKDSVLPEVDQYYEGERRDRAGLAWLLALVSVALVALILVGVFLAGRWAWRQVADNNDGEEVGVTDTADMPSFDGGNSEQTGENEQPKTETPSSPNTGNEQGSTNTPATGDNAPATTPATGDNAPASDLPSTGPAETVAVFTIVSTLAGTVHYAVTRRRD